ncbi:quinone oxidoreductase family protein [Jeotgalibacillus aurantiacus]|uniref:quinone oxidoreductase family protein n=1 Tax=Jeotgalibacillus aurantiacus TaxID=2763266 RepID=UPI001D0B4386|nr:zinc-binding dehydrogenase [Jeotgalibacillus aurantiacus]
MKAIVLDRFGGPEVLKVKDVDVPSISLNEVLIKVKKTSVNFADIKNRTGKKAAGEFPLILGLDAAGIIESTGPGVKNLKRGQRVIAFPKHGSYAEYVVADEQLTFPIPDELDFDVAAACPIVSFLSYMLLKRVGRIEKGDTVLVHAASGGVGTTAIQLARILGAGTIIGTVGDEKKLNTVKEAGADYALTYDEFYKHVNEITNHQGADIILDSISGKISEESMNCLAPYGRLVHFGNSSGEVGTYLTKNLHFSCRSVLGFSFGTTRKKKPEMLKEVSEEVFKILSDGSLNIKIGEQFNLEDANQAHILMESRQHVGKILLKVDE